MSEFDLESIIKIAREAGVAAARIIAREVIEGVSQGDIIVTEYLNQQCAARYCGYSEQYFNKVCRSGKGPPYVRVGRRWRTRRSWLQLYMESGGPHAHAAKDMTTRNPRDKQFSRRAGTIATLPENP
jgi:hypothetical protein